MPRDFYREFLAELDAQLDRFAAQARRKRPRAFVVSETSVEKAVRNFLCSQLTSNGCREAYDTRRKNGESVEAAAQWVYQTHLEPLLPKGNEPIDPFSSYAEHDFGFLKPYRGATAVLCNNRSQFDYWLPILERRPDESFLLLADFKVPDGFEAPEHTAVLELSFLPHEPVENAYLKRIFPQIYAYSTLFTALLDFLLPREVWVMDGGCEESVVLAALAGVRSIESVCYQQEWPSVFYTRFADMEYTRFCTWGDRFGELWGRCNPRVRFETYGYPYPVAPTKASNEVVFFLQVPTVVSDAAYLDELLQLAEAAARHCLAHGDGRTIRIRTERPLTQAQQARFVELPNAAIDSSMPLAEVFARAEVSVSVFSSAIVEGLAHGVIPVVYDPSNESDACSMPLDGLGLTAHDLPQAAAWLCGLIDDPTIRADYRARIAAVRPDLFACRN